MPIESNLIQTPYILVFELNLLKVLANTARSYRLGNNGVATNLGPGEQHFSRCSIEAFGNSFNLVVIDKERYASSIIAKGGVGSEEDAFLCAILDEILLDQAGVALYLVGGGGYSSSFDNILELQKC